MKDKAKISQRPAFGMAYMVHCGDSLNMVRVDVPEVLSSEDRKASFLPVLGTPPIAFQRRANGNWFYDQEVPHLRVGGTLDFEDDTLAMSLSITNTGTEKLTNITTQICVQLAAAPLFRDPERQYVHVTMDGRATCVRELDAREGARSICWLVKGMPPDPRRMPGTAPDGVMAWVRCSALQAEDGVISVASPDGAWTLGTLWEEARYVFNNPSATLACLHSDPYLGDMEPGQTITRHGWIAAINGSPQDLRNLLLNRLQT